MTAVPPAGRVDELLARLTLDEKALLTAGAGMWSTAAIERLGIPSVVVTDGPNGARGPALPGGGDLTSACVPSGSALGATWSPEVVERVGELLGAEARTKAARVLLAPTVNTHRSPLAGRNFECYSEDPLLSGRLAAAFVRGAQSQGVATTVKHFAGNDAEFERNTINSVIDERTLREITLVPFELAVREGGSLGVMTAYNRLNGTFCAEHEWLLHDVLRGEWGFEGFVVTDSFAQGSTAGSARAGLDLEMPGPGRFYGPALADAVRRGKVDEGLVDAAVRRLLTVFEGLGALDDPADARPASVDRPEHRAVCRVAATEATVLLRNEAVGSTPLLPLDPSRLRSLAVVGPNADRAVIMGGGSASLEPHYRITPLDAIRERLGETVAVRHEPGCVIDRTVPPLERARLTAPDGAPGFGVELFAGQERSGGVLHRSHRDGRILFFGHPAPGVDGLDEASFSLRASARFVPEETGAYRFALVQLGRARLFVDGRLVLDGVEHPPPPGEAFFGAGSAEVVADVPVVAGHPLELVVEWSSAGSAVLRGVQVGGRPVPPPDLLERAVDAATGADAVIVVVGTDADWETEGRDRESMDLPGDQDELVRRVAAANPRTVVVVNAGAPVTMDWADRVPAVLQVWFGGQEMAHALVDVLTGAAEPAGRLPTTIPLRVEDNPSYGNFPGADGEVRYEEGLLVGYRWYDTRRVPVRFPFGHGLSYTSFALGQPVVTAAASGGPVHVSVPVTNTGARRGAEVVQCYVAPPPARLPRPVKELKAFAKVWLDPGETGTVTLELDGERAFASWDPASAGWVVEPGVYELHVGRSAADIAHVVPVTVGS
ncbi:MAG TPA: glycoside hydrolase family 3 C-terminal domain-containing protein [Acidimicrobiia bacterium]|nr:glycoside hydrolase family 3 C-terminal domain-containing protein [Acidimicrobiia bacterium]